MSFLTPLYLLGALAVSAPLLFHLLRRTTGDRAPFGTLMFLSPSPPQVVRRSRMQHWPLLALRALSLCLLALAFARPFLRQPVQVEVPTDDARWTVFVVDVSASMRREGLWEQAMATLVRSVAEHRLADKAALLVFDRSVRPLVSFEEWTEVPYESRAQLIATRLSEAEPGWSSTHLDTALLAACDLLDSASARRARALSAPRRSIVLISDLQRGSRRAALEASDWPSDIGLLARRVVADRSTNAGIRFAPEAADRIDPAAEVRPKIRVSNSLDAERERFTLRWASAPESTDQAVDASAPQSPSVDAYVPPGESRVVSMPAPTNSVDRVVLEGDDHPFDNSAYSVPPRRERLTVLYLGDDAPDDPKAPRFYIERAFPPTRLRTVEVLSPDADSPLPPEAVDARLIVLGGSASVERCDALRRFLERGGTVLAGLRSASDATTVERLVGTTGFALEEEAVDGYAMLSDIDFSHPLFEPFADPRYSDFTKIRFWKHRRLDPAILSEARVLARFDGAAPALIEIPVGRGSLFLLTSGWHPEDSQLALSSKFVPLVNGLISVGRTDEFGSARRHVVGDRVQLPAPSSESEARLRVRKPDGTEVEAPAPGPWTFADTDAVGVYRIVSEAEEPSFAVDLDASESRTAPIPDEEIERWTATGKAPPDASEPAPSLDTQRQLQAHELEKKQRLWHWLVAGALATLACETWLAGRLCRA